MKRKAGTDDKQRTISSFFASHAPKVTKPLGQQPAILRTQLQHAPAEPTHKSQPKRQKSSDISDVIIIDGSLEDRVNGQALPEPKAVDVAPAAVPLAYIPTSRNKARHHKAQHKLVGSADARSLEEPGPGQPHAVAGVSGAAGGSSSRRQQQPNYTPLEKQIVKLKEENPGVLLVVEVGYKFRFFGSDAQIAANELGLYCYPDHNFLTASFPVQRLPIHVRRLVAAGHKVGVVRQIESAALKAVSDNRSAPFTRQLTGLFTAATLDAGEKADKLGEASAMEASQELESLLGAATAAPAAANYLLVIAEQQQQPGGSNADPQQVRSGSSSSSGVLGVLAVDVGSGDIAYGLCSCSSSRSSSGSNGSSNGSGITPLEAVLLSVAPADIVIVEPVSTTINRLLSSYMAGSSRRCRIDCLQQQQSGGSSSSSGGEGYLDSANLKQLQEFYGGSTSDGVPESKTPAANAAAAGAGSSDDLQFILSLPHMVLLALCGALQYLRAFGLTSVLQCTSGFRALGVGRHMQLDGNALRQLQILSTGVDDPSPASNSSVQGSLLHLLDRCSTAAGGRLLRRWLAAPLADRNMILDRQDAVQALLEASQGSSSGSNSGDASLLVTLRSWLRGQRVDVERCLSRMAAGTAAPAEAVALLTTLAQLPKALKLPLDTGTQQLDLTALAAAVPSRLLVSLLATAAGSSAVAAAAEVLGWVDAAAAVKNDYIGVFKSKEKFPEVFACAAAVSSAESHLQGLLPQLAAAAGVPSLSYVSVQNQGNWMVELPATRTDIPQGWEKVCGTKKVNRYHSPDVKSGTAALARAQEQQQATCAAAWQTLLREFTQQHYGACREAVSALAELDALQALAEVASSPGYCRPVFLPDDQPQQIVITDGKHPMLDLALDGAAVGNSLELRWDGVRAAVITGPNMGGKSVLIRQAAVTVIMAHLGSWVAAAGCQLSVFDGVFSRMGASDSLMLGRSTFAEELEDASHILQTATNRSLVIIDELGRGTATHDGVAIATATLQHLVAVKQCLTLFVTHYPEVAALADHSSSSSSSAMTPTATAAAAAGGSGDGAAAGCQGHIAVYHMSHVRQDPPETAAAAAAGDGGGGEMSSSTAAASSAAAAAASSAAAATAAASIPVITFLYKLTPGAADASFGLNVAQMAGLPQSVVQKAALIATQLKDRVELQQQEQQREQEADQGSAPPPAAAAAGTPSAVLEACNLVEGKVFKAVQQVVDVLRASGKGAQAGQQQQEGDHRPADVPGSQLAQVQQEIQQILVADVYQL